MLTDFIGTKLGMTQVWTAAGRRLPVTRIKTAANFVVGSQPTADATIANLEVAAGHKKLSSMSKSLRTRFEKAKVNSGARVIRGSKFAVSAESPVPAMGTPIKIEQVLSEGDVVDVQGTSKGRGFAGGVKRHGFHGGPKTHGQSDRWRAIGAIGSRTTPGRVFKDHRMPGHFGVDTNTVQGLVVLRIDQENDEIWLSGPVPGSLQSLLRLRKTGQRRPIKLAGDQAKLEVTEEVEAAPATEATSVVETDQPELTTEPEAI